MKSISVKMKLKNDLLHGMWLLSSNLLNLIWTLHIMKVFFITIVLVFYETTVLIEQLIYKKIILIEIYS